ncbi:GFA family protein [Eionea flava]
MVLPIKASCQCGQVSYILRKAPTNVWACHCKECQKLSTSPFSVTAFVDASDITFTGEMRQWERKAESGHRNIAYFCSGCGNRIYHLNPFAPQSIKLKLKPTCSSGLNTLTEEDAFLFSPSAHIWVSEKVAWYELPEHLPAYAKQPS